MLDQLPLEILMEIMKFLNDPISIQFLVSTSRHLYKSLRTRTTTQLFNDSPSSSSSPFPLSPIRTLGSISNALTIDFRNFKGQDLNVGLLCMSERFSIQTLILDGTNVNQKTMEIVISNQSQTLSTLSIEDCVQLFSNNKKEQLKRKQSSTIDESLSKLNISSINENKQEQQQQQQQPREETREKPTLEDIEKMRMNKKAITSKRLFTSPAHNNGNGNNTTTTPSSSSINATPNSNSPKTPGGGSTRKIVPEWFFRMSTQCIRLENLNLRGCTHFSFLHCLLKHSQKLRSLIVQNCISLRSDAVVESLKSPFLTLESLNLSGCFRLSDEAIVTISKFCPNLVDFQLDTVKNVTHACLASISTLRFLRKLTLRGCTAIVNSLAIFEFLCMTSNHLQFLSFKLCPQISDFAFTGPNDQRKLPQLSLKGLDIQQCIRLTDKALISIAQACPNLETLDVRELRSLTDSAFSALALHCPSLQHIQARQVSNLTDQPLLELVENCRNLKILDLRECSLISDYGCSTLDRLQETLTILHLGNCQTLTDRTLINVVSKLKKLEIINLEQCTLLTDKGFSKLPSSLLTLNIRNNQNATIQGLSHLSRLQNLTVTNCVHFPSDSTELEANLRKVFPRLKRLTIGLRQQPSSSNNVESKNEL